MSSDWSSKVSRNYDQQERRKAAQDQRRSVSSEGADERQGSLAVLGEVLGLPQAALKDAIGVGENWVDGPITVPRNSVTGVNFSDPGQPLPDEDIAPGVNLALDMTVDPLNLLGAGLFSSGVKGARAIAGADSLKGNALSSARNYIDNHYGASGNAVPNRVDEFISNNVGMLSKIPKVGPRLADIKNPQDSANMREKVGSFVGWAGDSLRRGVEQTISPSARANYREFGINKTTQDVAQEALEAGGTRDMGKAVAQVQASGTLIPDQAGRVGRVSEDIKDIERRSYLTEPVPITKGSYTNLIKDNKLQGSYESGKRVSIPDKDLNIIDEHVRSVWKGADDKPIGESAGSQIRIKNPGAGDQRAGAHHGDFAAKSTVMPALRRLFKDGKKRSTEEIHEFVKSSKNKKMSLHPKSETLADAKENGIWITGSFVGNAVTEGGVNYIAKIDNNGRIMAVISDEHNFLEKAPVVGDLVTEALPNRSLSVTAPMFFDAAKNKATIKSPQPKDKKNVEQSLRNIVDTTPSEKLLDQERKVNAGAYLVGTGMLTGRENNRRRNQ
jgi:hypothetical protein